MKKFDFYKKKFIYVKYLDSFAKSIPHGYKRQS